MIGASLAVVGLLVAAVQGGLIRYTNPLLGNEKSVYVGLALYAAGMFLFATATQGWMMFLFLIPYCLGGIAGPAIQAIISGHVPPNEQGELQGALTSLMSATSIIGPPLMTGLICIFYACHCSGLFSRRFVFFRRNIISCKCITRLPCIEDGEKSNRLSVFTEKNYQATVSSVAFVLAKNG